MPMATPEAQREYQRRWMARRRAEWFEANGPCVDCGTWEALELDHVDGAAKVSHRVWSWARVRREAELAKCVARCRPCHDVKSVPEAQHLGEANGRSRLTADDVLEVRRRAAAGDPYRRIAADYSMSIGSLGKVIRRETWGHV